MPKLPIDFEQKVKQAPAAGGTGYPYRISARDLMENFNYCLVEADPTEVSGLYLEEYADPFGRFFRLAGELVGGGGGLADGTQAGQMLYWIDDAWVTLSPPTEPPAGSRAILTHNGTTPEWLEIEEITLDYVDDNNTVATGKFLKLPMPD